MTDTYPEGTSLRDMFKEAQMANPAELLLKRVMTATQVTRNTAVGWITGNFTPGKSSLLLLEREFGRPWRELFPEIAKRKEACDGRD